MGLSSALGVLLLGASTGVVVAQTSPQVTPVCVATNGLRYAAKESWFVDDERIAVRGRYFVKLGRPREIALAEVVSEEEYEGVPVFKERGGLYAPEVVYVPTGPGCIFQPYALEIWDPAPRGGRNGFSRFEPWPPPAASDRVVITRLVFPRDGRLPTYRQAADRLELAFRRAGYTHFSYLAVPGGFAMVTPFEEFRQGGAPREHDRFYFGDPLDEVRTTRDLTDALANVSSGHYRLIVVTVTPYPFTGGPRRLTAAEERVWKENGPRDLPVRLAERRVESGSAVTVMVYEFERETDRGPVTFRAVPRHRVEEHLRNSRVWSELAGR